MARFVLSIFKTIILSIVLIFTIDMVFYLYKAYNVYERMDTLMVSIQKVVMENNYLPEGSYNMFMQIADTIGKDMNGGVEDSFIQYQNGHAMRLNYNMTDTPESQPLGKGVLTDSLGNDILSPENLCLPADYGQVRYIEASVKVAQPIWFFTSDNRSMNNWKRARTNERTDASEASKWTDNKGKVVDCMTFHFKAYVPCLHYQAVTAS